MYLSRVEIDRNNRQKTKDLTHIGAFHNWVEKSFPDEFEERIRSRKLWRIDQLQGKEYLLLVSETKPNLAALERYGVEGTAQTKNYEPFLSKIQEGEKFKFRLTVNPVVSVPNKGQKRGRVFPHITTDHQMQFLLNRAEKNGFSLEETNYSITEREFIPFKKSGEKIVRLSKVTYEGILTVNNKELFIYLLTHGMGKKKAYGFGLMTVILMS